MPSPFKITVVTTSRADYGIYLPVLKALSADSDFDLSLIVGGAHLSEAYGRSVKEIEKDGYPIAARVYCVPDDDRDVSIAAVMGLATTNFAKELDIIRPDLMIVLGDRYEMHSAVLAALPLRIPVAHIHGGEETEGAMDNSLRHSITKLSHLHMCSTELAASRIRAMGEDPQSVVVSGAPALDSILSFKPLSRREWAASLGLPDRDYILLTYHPETLAPDSTLDDLDTIWSAVKEYAGMCVISLSNADTSGQRLNARLNEIASRHEYVFLVNNMGIRRYYSAMEHAEMMIGNSSSGIIEGASFGLPVINIGDRQKGREISPNTLNANVDCLDIQQAMRAVLTPQYLEICMKKENVYGDGNASQQILAAIKNYFCRQTGVQKHFHLIRPVS